MIKRFISIAISLITVFSIAACGGTGTSGSNVVNLYTADGLGAWYKLAAAEFKKQTGISINIRESGSGEVVSSLLGSRNNNQADVMVSSPPYVQQANDDGLLVPSGINTSGVFPEDIGPNKTYITFLNDFMCFIVNKNLNPKPKTWDDLLKPEFRNKLQYSTPGEAADGTAFLLIILHLMGDKAGYKYFSQLQKNTVGPSSSTGKLQPKVAQGDILVANGDIQMNLLSIMDDKSNFDIFIPKTNDGQTVTMPIPYQMGLVKNAPHKENAMKFMQFLISKKTQDTIMDKASGFPVRKDSYHKSQSPLNPISILGTAKVWTPDWEQVAKQLPETIKNYKESIK